MTGSTILDRLRPGRDANDTSWVIVQGREAWQAGPVARSVGWDAKAPGLTLAPRARPDLAADWLPSGPAIGSDGTLYMVDPEADLLLWQKPCTAGFVPVPGFGGHGHATLRFDTPVSVTADAAGLLYVADAGNARVQVIDPLLREAVAVLQVGLRRPVHVAIGPDGRIVVADAASGALHVFQPGFGTGPVLPLGSLDPWTGEAWPDAPPPRPLAVAILPDGSLSAFDPLRPLLWHMTCDGRPLPALPWPRADGRPPGWAATPARFDALGEVVVGPIDGAEHGLPWHRILIDADLLPGTRIAAQTFAADALDPPLAWAPRRPVPLPRARADRAGQDFDRLILPNSDQWSLWRLGLMRRNQPMIHRYDGDGPMGGDTLSLPAAVADRLRPGDTVSLTTPEGGQDSYTVTAIADRSMTLAASGPGEAFANPAVLRLIARDDVDLPFGALDLAFLVDPAVLNLGALPRDGFGQPAQLPHALAAFLRTGDVVVLSDDAAARLEVLEPEVEAADVAVTLDRPVAGDFSRALLHLIGTVGRLAVQEALPDVGQMATGTTLHVIDDARREAQDVAWVEAATGTIWLTRPLGGAVTARSWTNAAFDPPAATDRGRYLWIRLVLTGAAIPAPGAVGPVQVAEASPVLRGLRVLAPRPSLLAWLPAVFAQGDPLIDPPGAGFLERFLALFEGRLTAMEAAFDSVQRLMNPRAADAEWLEFVAAWLDLAFDPSWPEDARRQLVIEGAALQAGSGTPAAMARYLEIYTGAPVGVIESYRRAPAAPIQLGARGALGVAPLAGSANTGFAHDFEVYVTLPPGRDRAASLSAIRRIVETVKPAHTTWQLNTVAGGASRIGMDTAIDSIVIPGAGPLCPPDPCDDPSPDLPRSGHRADGFWLGGRLGLASTSGISQGVGQ